MTHYMKYLYYFTLVAFLFAAFLSGRRIGRLEAVTVASESYDAMCSECYYKGFDKAKLEMKKEMEKECGDDTTGQGERY